MGLPGYAGNILHVDLTSGKLKKEALDPKLAREFIGGYGINNRLAHDYIPPHVEPLSSENAIIIGTGPFNGTVIPGAAKGMVATKFPLGGTFGNSGIGGSFPLMLKSAGYDHVIITGQAQQPVYLKIGDDVQLLDASDLWGKDTFETTDELRNRHEPCSVIPIGQSGENLVKPSLTVVDKVATTGRGGLPAVMGFKNLKAIVAVEGSATLRVADPPGLMRLIDRLVERIRRWPWRQALVDAGYDGFVTMRMGGSTRLNPSGSNWTEESVRMDEKDMDYYRKLFMENRKPLACATCPLGDKNRVEIKEGEYAGLTSYCADFFPTGEIGWMTKAGIDGLGQMVKYFDMLNRYGICCYEFCNTLEFIIYLYKRGIITLEDTGGVDLKEDEETFMKVLRMTAYREGFGNILAEGVFGIATRIGRGAEDVAYQIKGYTPAWMQDPRVSGLQTMQINFIVNPRGSHAAAGGSPAYEPGSDVSQFARHADRMGASKEAVERIVGPAYVNMGRFTTVSQNWYSLFSSVGLCNRLQVNRFYSAAIITDLYTAVTGVETTKEDLMKAVQRGWYLEKMLNVREGFSRKDDRPPAAWFTPVKARDGKEHPMTDYFGNPVSREDFNQALDDYYEERGLDKNTGNPTPEKLKEMGLENLVR